MLSVKATAQDNRSVCVLTKDGIEYSTLFGGPKSRLCGSVSPWNSGTMFFYNNAEKQSSKITDFDVKKYHPTFRENLFKSFAAALAAEVVIKSKCGGSPQSAFVLLNGFLDGMDLCDEEKSRLGLLRFLWRYLDLLGVRPLTECCARCGNKFDFTSGNFSQNVLYSSAEGGFVCGECFSPGEGGTRKDAVRISANALFYLDAAGKENMAAARSLALESGDYNTLKSFLYEAVENALGLKLKTLVSGSGIL